MPSGSAPSPRLRFIFVASNLTWGGSEELWSAAAVKLGEAGHEISALVSYPVDKTVTNIRRLGELGCRFTELDHYPLVPRWAIKVVRRLSPSLFAVLRGVQLRLKLLARRRPHLIVVSQGANLDGVRLADVCRRLRLPYVLLSQKAQEALGPYDTTFASCRQAYASAKWSFFVSRHNWRVTEEQLGLALDRASVVRNPFLTPWDSPQAWPDETGGLRLACIGRLYPFDKGQDIALRVMAMPKWRERPVRLTFFGTGSHGRSLEAMAGHLGLDNVEFAGFVPDPASIWATHHGLFLPTRGEGLPLVLVEAMLSRRVAIVTEVAGIPEVLEDNRTGFLAHAATDKSVDEALERAWSRRAEWPQIGEAAQQAIKALTPMDPPAFFAEQLLSLTGDPPGSVADPWGRRP